MRVAVISDIHGNLQGLEAILADIERAGIERIWCLGDIVGYGADPEPCIGLIRQYAELVIAGNHEWALLDRFDVGRFNPLARYCIEWGRLRISEPSKQWLASLLLTATCENSRLVHGKIPGIENFRYPRTLDDGREMLNACGEQVVLFGHTHHPVSWRMLGNGQLDCGFEKCGRLEVGERVVLNPGSTGQPRNSDPRVSWLELHPAAVYWQLHQVDYDVHGAVARMREEELPEVLAAALLKGLDT